MIALYDVESGAKVGRITEQQRDALIDWMEEENSEDREYYLTAEDCELMEEQGLDPSLIDSAAPRAQRPRGHGPALSE